MANFSDTFIGIRKIEYPECDLPLISDFSSKGSAIYKGKYWFVGLWEKELKLAIISFGQIISSPSSDVYDESIINELEVYPIVSVLRSWYPE